MNRSEIAANWTGPDYVDTWTCLNCEEEMVNQGHYDEVCSNCRCMKPTECDLCEEQFIPWQEFKGDRYEHYLCQSCYFSEPDPYGGIDRDQGEDR